MPRAGLGSVPFIDEGRDLVFNRVCRCSLNIAIQILEVH